MIKNSNQIKKILVISLSNIGDIILTFPVIDILRRDFPSAAIDLIIGPKGESLVKGNPSFRKIYLYNKKESGWALFQWMRELAREHYDLAVDLRNTAIPFLIFAKHKTPVMFRRPGGIHMRQQHLLRLKTVHDFLQESRERFSLNISAEDKKIAEQQFSLSSPVAGAGFHDLKFIVFAPGSRAENKRWHSRGFAQLADALAERYLVKPVFVGDENDVKVVKKITAMMKSPAVDLSGHLTLTQLASVMSRASLAVVNDSAPLHLASYLDIPVVALFGPTDPQKYGPWSSRSFIVRRNEACLACRGDKEMPHDCLGAVSVEDVLSMVEPVLPEILNAREKT